MTPTKTLEVNGDILATGDVSLGGEDCAEDFDVRDRAELVTADRPLQDIVNDATSSPNVIVTGFTAGERGMSERREATDETE
jgi:hypothetical protein